MVWSVVLRETQKKNLNDMERTEQKRQQKSKAKKKKKKKAKQTYDQIIRNEI